MVLFRAMLIVAMMSFSGKAKLPKLDVIHMREESSNTHWIAILSGLRV